MTFALTFVVFHEVLGLLAPFVGSCQGHAMFECCQYVLDDSKVCVGLFSISIKEAQFILQKTITWTKKSDKGCQKWQKACEQVGVPPQKLKTLMKFHFALRVVLFQETFELKHVIVLYYGSQQSLTLQGRVLNPQVWAIAQVVTNTLGLMVQQCVLNQKQ